MSLKAQRAAALQAAKTIVDRAAAEGRELADDERTEVKNLMETVDRLTEQIKASEESRALVERLSALGADVEPDASERGQKARSIGEHFVKELAGRKIKELAQFVTTEYKANTDTQSTGGASGAFGRFLTDVDRAFVFPYRRRLVVADLLGTGTVSGSAITYPVFGALEGNTAFVAEGGAKPQIHVADPTWQTDALGEVAGWFKITDDMAEDLDFVVSEIEGTARYDLLLKEELALLSGNGTPPNLRGILNRSGVQTESATDKTDNFDAIYRAIAKVQTGTDFAADGIVIHPTDYQTLRLARDGNDQYIAGGPFTGQYGNGEIMEQPPIWGLRTVVTSAISTGTVLVGAFQSAKVFRKGGLRVESTNSHADDFTNDKITIRLRERLGLQVKYPAAFVNVTLSNQDPAE